MAFIVANRVQQVSTTTLDNLIEFTSTPNGYQSFNSVLSNGDETYYCMVGTSGASLANGEWEVGTGIWDATSQTLSRLNVTTNFSEGDKDVFITYPAEKAVILRPDTNIAIGDYAFEANTDGYNNVAIGQAALQSNSTGDFNNVIGYGALSSNTDGNYNTAVGSNAGYTNTTGSNNTFIGNDALLSNTIGNSNTAVGSNAGHTNTTGGNNTFIGNDAIGVSATANNNITLGNNAVTLLRCQVTSITSLSDRRDKTNIVNIPAGLSFIEALRPVSFDWNMRDGGKVGIKEFGFIAQDLLTAQNETGITVPNLVSEENPDKLEASAGVLIPVLVKAIQELKAEVEALKLVVGAK